MLVLLAGCASCLGMPSGRAKEMLQIHDAAPAVALPAPEAAPLTPIEQEVIEIKGLSVETTMLHQQREDTMAGSSGPLLVQVATCSSVRDDACPQGSFRFLLTPPLFSPTTCTLCPHHYRLSFTHGHISVGRSGVTHRSQRVQPTDDQR